MWWMDDDFDIWQVCPTIRPEGKWFAASSRILSERPTRPVKNQAAQVLETNGLIET